MYIDTHSHIYGEEFAEDRTEVIERMRDAGVRQVIFPDIDSMSRDVMFEVAAEYPDMMFPCLGVHPTSVNSGYKEEMGKMEHLLGLVPCYAIGECGIDLYWDRTYVKEQTEVFERHVSIAREVRLPIIVHARESTGMILDIMDGYPDVRGVLHCFSGTKEEAHRAIEMGLMLGIGGVVTFKKGGMDKIVEEVGLEHILLETDSPYLAPVPYRGKRNESSYIPLIAQKVADILGVALCDVAERTTENARRMFDLKMLK